MGSSHFSGPVKAGTVREGSAANVGTMVLVQSAAWVQSTTAVSTGIVIPSGCQVIAMTMYITTAPDAGNITIGTDGTPVEWVSAVAAGTSADVTVDLMSGTNVDVDLFENVGTSDVTVWLDCSAGTSGRGTFTITYAQAMAL